MTRSLRIVFVVLALGAGLLCAGCATSQAASAQASASQDINTVDMAYVQNHQDSAKFVDTRTYEEFAAETGEERAGHIPGAVHFGEDKLVDPDGQPKSAQRLVKMFEYQELLPTDDIVVYGGSDTTSAYAVAQALAGNGYAHVSVYEGGYAEWASDASNPVDDQVPSCCSAE